MCAAVMGRSNFEGLHLLKRGKVRDVYEIDDMLLIVASDRMSAFDVVMDDPIPDKGKILTKISLFWFDKLTPIVENHLISSDPMEYPHVCQKYADQLAGRSMLVKKTRPLAVECIVRGYISGSGWKDYLSTGSVCGISLPQGLKESQKLSEPLFTPSTKAEDGMHDENISFERAVDIVGKEIAHEVKRLSLKIYEYGRDLALQKGIIVADTKFEFGIKDGRLILIDEALTPDSSRFWPMDEYREGGPQKSFDKQFLRDYLEKIRWPKQPPPPKLPADIIEKTRRKYLDALSRLTGHGLEA
ncbi:Phosphoribosylaminoimidazole-succinocarboxamide synthase [uncultured Desulfobacterium sp.]|uniref:Phosphoribosylaminoimidazole-succinocarboxamide synthase n=1 Tax=uncultured Desulfobacterium sp. TaxID=201089 RepID=A0A445MRA9_9BACT|nr:Phosphoribosylaminoimidazole-succinocarboxamide synthase [uncultured Desulfobacterium sp.]